MAREGAAGAVDGNVFQRDPGAARVAAALSPRAGERPRDGRCPPEVTKHRVAHADGADAAALPGTEFRLAVEIDVDRFLDVVEDKVFERHILKSA